MAELKVGVLASGRGSNLEALITRARGYRVVAAVSDRAGSLALERAKNHGCAAVHIDPAAFSGREAYETAVADALAGFGAELVCLAGYMRLVGKVLLERFSGRVLNIHPALLPAFPGLHGQRQALEYGVRFSGCTVHFVDGDMDTGPIILQAVVPVLGDDTEETLSDRILAQEHRIYPEAVALYAQARLTLEGRRVRIG
ncbi:MAG: phosphoribosylglycinamide formyltransferase [Peptococcaceae bacterium]|nr:phosphoribosylglycinamide formyltransferase [Peptococcaceae bacterium]